jgi:hypothetical protein
MRIFNFMHEPANLGSYGSTRLGSLAKINKGVWSRTIFRKIHGQLGYWNVQTRGHYGKERASTCTTTYSWGVPI